MALIYFETDRLIIRQWMLSDVDELYKLMSDDRVHLYTSSGAWSKEKAERYIRFILDKNFQTLALFHAACVLKDSNLLIGLTGLNPYLSHQPEMEWKLGVPYWGKGYATEIGKAIVKESFASTDVSAIYGITMSENLASQRVLQKIGMTCLGLREFRGNQDVFYRIEKT